MPLYEYKCAACGEVFEVMQKFSDQPLKVHPACGGPVERLVSAPALQFKGTGWYVTDYGRNGSRKESAKEDSKPLPAEAAKGAPAKPLDSAPAKAKQPAQSQA